MYFIKASSVCHEQMMERLRASVRNVSWRKRRWCSSGTLIDKRVSIPVSKVSWKSRHWTTHDIFVVVHGIFLLHATREARVDAAGVIVFSRCTLLWLKVYSSGVVKVIVKSRTPWQGPLYVPSAGKSVALGERFSGNIAPKRIPEIGSCFVGSLLRLDPWYSSQSISSYASARNCPTLL